MQVVADQPVAAGEVPDESVPVLLGARRERGQLQSGRPTLGPRSQQLDVGRLEPELERAVQQRFGLRLAEAEVGRSDLGHLAGRAQAARPGAEGRRRLAIARCRRARQVAEQERERRVDRLGAHQVVVVEDEHERLAPARPAR